MRSLDFQEVRLVAGGNRGGNRGGSSSTNSSGRSAALLQCRGLPADTKVTYSYTVSASAGGKVMGVGGEAVATQHVTITTTCGALRAAEKATE